MVIHWCEVLMLLPLVLGVVMLGCSILVPKMRARRCDAEARNAAAMLCKTSEQSIAGIP